MNISHSRLMQFLSILIWNKIQVVNKTIKRELNSEKSSALFLLIPYKAEFHITSVGVFPKYSLKTLLKYAGVLNPHISLTSVTLYSPERSFSIA